MHRPLPHACQDEVHNAFGRTVDGIGGMRLQECALALLPVMLTRRCYATLSDQRQRQLLRWLFLLLRREI